MAIRSDASTIDTGSSATMSAGPGMSARAIATRCNWPPDSSCGKRRLISTKERPTLRARLVRQALGVGALPCAGGGARGREKVAVDAVQRIEGFKRVLEDRLYRCHEAHARAPSAGPGHVGPAEPYRAPVVGATRFRIMRERVVLPLPDSPTTVKISDRSAESEKLTSSTARKVPPPKRPPRE